MSPGGGSLNGCLAVAGFAAALYLNSLNGEFVFDDHEAIETNMDVRYLVIDTQCTTYSYLYAHDTA